MPRKNYSLLKVIALKTLLGLSFSLSSAFASPTTDLSGLEDMEPSARYHYIRKIIQI